MLEHIGRILTCATIHSHTIIQPKSLHDIAVFILRTHAVPSASH